MGAVFGIPAPFIPEQSLVLPRRRLWLIYQDGVVLVRKFGIQWLAF